MKIKLDPEGLAKRRHVLGDDYVDSALSRLNAFNAPLQQLVTEYCWGRLWHRPGLDDQQRSLINLALIAALNRPLELKAHIRGAIRNGLSTQDIAEV